MRRLRQPWRFLWGVLRYPIIVLLAPIVWLSIFSERCNLAYHILRACQGAVNLARAIAGVTYFLGVITTVGLLATSIMVLIHIVFMEIGLPMPRLQAYYEIAARIFENKAAWAAATIVIATTVALFHLKNLEINQARYLAELEDRRKKEREEIQKGVDAYRHATQVR